MIIAITGASGFLGINLIEELLKKDTNFILAFTSQKKTLENKFKNRHVNVFEREAFFKVQLKDVDVLINCAFPRNNDNRQMAVGLKYVNDVLNHTVHCGVKTVINISSQSVYSQQKEHAADEYTELCLDSIYAVGKFASELLTNTICKNIRHTNIRLASLIGPDFDQRLVNKMIDNALARQYYEDGIRLSFEERGASGAETYIADNTSMPDIYTDPLGANSYTRRMSECRIAWDAAGDLETNLEQIITQKWIAIFPLGTEAWCEYRRTGYPKLLPAVQNLGPDNVDLNHHARRLTYPVEEYSSNGANVNEAVGILNSESADGSGDSMATRVWWDCKDYSLSE